MSGLLSVKIHYYYGMKKFLIILLSLGLLSVPVYADSDIDLPATDDLWDDWNGTNQDGREVKPVSDEDFDKAVEQVDKKINKRKYKQMKKQIPKGEEFHQSNETEIINEQSDKGTLPVLSIPVELEVGEGNFLPVGHYQIKGEKDEEGNVYINFFQSQYLLAKFPATETEDDFNQDTIVFGEWFPEDDDKIKVIFGSMDFNAYTYIKLKTPTVETTNW